MHQPNTSNNFDADSEYRAIEATLLETARGRWFLAEHGRRARRLDSVLLEDAMQKLQSCLREPPALLGQMQREIDELREHIAATRTLMVGKPTVSEPDLGGAGILKEAEHIHEIAWALQARDVDPGACEAIGRHAARLYALSQSQASESTRALAFAESLDRLTARLSDVLQTIHHEMDADGTLAPVEATTAIAV